MPATATRPSSRSASSAKKSSAPRSERKPAAPAMTAAEATVFEEVSSRSAQQIMDAIDERAKTGVHADCKCLPYDDVFTYNRWKAQGQQVSRGEKSLELQSFVARGEKADADGEQAQAGRPGLIPRRMFLFCRCQVKPIDATA